MSNISNKFNFFVPATFEKAKDGSGKELVKIKGIANTSSAEDSDGETLFPEGFDSTPFLTKGFFNYNHQANKTSKAICGEPTLAKAINGGKDYYVEGFLYPNEEGKAIAELAETLEKVGSNRRIGFSIEGQAVERDPFNNKKITKARITGCAITLSAKNPNTWLSIVKGEYDEAYIDESGLGIDSLVDEYNNWIGDKKSEFYGKDGSVKEFLENHHEDNMDLLPELMLAVNKAIDTAAIAPTTPESVENQNNNKKSSNFDKLITKSNIYLSIAKQYPTASIAETKSIYTLIQEVNTKMFKMENNQKVYPEAIQKAFDLLNNAQSLIKGETTEAIVTDIVKGEEADEEEVEKALPFAEMLSKAGFDKDKACDTMCKGGISLVVAQGAWEKVISAANAAKDGDKEPEQVTAPIVKGEEDVILDANPPVDIQNEIKKSLEPFAGTLSGIGEAIKQGFAGYNDLIKSMQDTNNALVQRIEQLERTPQPVKSITANNAIVADRFAKSQETTALPVGTEAYNVNNREDLKKLSQRLMDEIEVNYIQKGKEVDPLLEGTINHIEIGKVVPEFAYGRLRAMGIILQKG